MVGLLGLTNFREVEERYADGVRHKTRAYMVDITFPNGRHAHAYSTVHKSDDFDFIIGMELISFGTFLLERLPDESVRFTFSVE